MIDINITKESISNATTLKFQFTDFLGNKKVTDMSHYLVKFRDWDIEKLKKRTRSLMIEYSKQYWVTMFLDGEQVAWIQHADF